MILTLQQSYVKRDHYCLGSCCEKLGAVGRYLLTTILTCNLMGWLQLTSSLVILMEWLKHRITLISLNWNDWEWEGYLMSGYLKNYYFKRWYERNNIFRVCYFLNLLRKYPNPLMLSSGKLLILMEVASGKFEKVIHIIFSET